MTKNLVAHFDGKVLVLEGPVELPTGRRLRVRVELVDETEPRFAALLGFEADLAGAPTELAAQLDHYLTGAHLAD